MKIQKNIGGTDKKIRLTLGVLLLVISLIFSGIFQVIFLIMGSVLIITALIGFCGLYTFLGINTCKLDQRTKKKN